MKKRLVTDIDMDLLADAELLDVWQINAEAEKEAHNIRQRVESILEQRMRQRGAEAIPHERYECWLDKGMPSVDILAIQALRELIPPDVLAEGVVEAHTETVVVPERWNLTKVNAWTKFGFEVADVIARSKIYSQARIRIKGKG